MTNKLPTIGNESTGPPNSEAFLSAMRRLRQTDNQDEDALSLLVHITKRLIDCDITLCTTADLIENSFNHGCEKLEQGGLISRPMAWIKMDCERQIKKLKHVQKNKRSLAEQPGERASAPVDTSKVDASV